MSGEPLPTTPPGSSELLCDLIPRESVATALGRDPDDLQIQLGGLKRDSATSHVYGDCRIESETGSESAMAAGVIWPSDEEHPEIRRVTAADPDYRFPEAVGTGYSIAHRGDDGAPSALANVIRGDYVVYVRITEGAEGRDPVQDAAALSQQIITALRLPGSPGATTP